MAWSVDTLSRTLIVGTCLCLTDLCASMEPQASSGRYPKAGDRFLIRTGADSVNATVVSSTELELIIATDADSWRLTPWTRGDDPMRAQLPGMHSEYWVIRSRV